LWTLDWYSLWAVWVRPHLRDRIVNDLHYTVVVRRIGHFASLPDPADQAHVAQHPQMPGDQGPRSAGLLDQLMHEPLTIGEQVHDRDPNR
jgi:hypothetical protein